ncbi:hypothetical protein CHARACLAT_026542, partial [Characodon lateralis]|nr:hypothetical protein [Characodon lateralis]
EDAFSLSPAPLPYLPCFSSVSCLLFGASFCISSKFLVMDLVSWSLNAIDQIFSRRRQGEGEPNLSGWDVFSGYTMDSWQKWRIVCLSIMSVEDVEDMYIIGCLISGFLLFGVSGYLAY